MERVHEDLQTAEEFLEAGDSGKLTRLVQLDIEASLQELIDALNSRPKKRRKPKNESEEEKLERLRREQEQGEQPPQQPRRRPMFNPVKELKLVLGMQRRIRSRTETLRDLGALPPDEVQPEPEPIPAVDSVARRKEMELRARSVERIAVAQTRLAGLLKSMVESYPEIDLFLLGADNEPEEEDADEIPGEDDFAPEEPDEADTEPRRRTRLPAEPDVPTPEVDPVDDSDLERLRKKDSNTRERP